MTDATTSTPGSLTHLMTVDVEDYFQVEAFAGSISRRSWHNWPSRIEDNTKRILDLFDTYHTKSTFFFVGWIADRYPALVREVQARGHELACHSYWHRPVYYLTPEEFRVDTRAARQAVEQSAGVPILGYRAPTWSVTRSSLWALDILAEEGFTYDSSIYPIKHDLYGVPDAPRFPYVHMCNNGHRLKEFPPCTLRFAGANFPAAGGGYLRIFPMFYTRWVFHQYEKRYRSPVVVYFHPWEVDPDQPRVADKLRSRLRHYINLSRMGARLEYLVKTHRFQPIREALPLATTEMNISREPSQEAV